MRIAIDARKYRDFGIGTYIRNLVRQLARIDGTTEYVLLCKEQDHAELSTVGPNFRAVVETALPYSVAEQVRIPMAIRREHADLFHAPHYVLPPLINCRSVVTIHDSIHLMFPQYLPGRLAYGYAKTSLWLATRRSNRILTVSETSKSDILRRFRRAGGQDHRDLQRDRRAPQRDASARRRSSGCASATSCATRSPSTSATSSRTRTSSA